MRLIHLSTAQNDNYNTGALEPLADRRRAFRFGNRTYDFPSFAIAARCALSYAGFGTIDYAARGAIPIHERLCAAALLSLQTVRSEFYK